MRCYFNMRSKADTSQLNLPHVINNLLKSGKTEKLKSKKWTCSEVSVNSPRNPWSQSWRRKGRLRWKGYAAKEGFKPGMKQQLLLVTARRLTDCEGAPASTMSCMNWSKLLTSRRPLYFLVTEFDDQKNRTLQYQQSHTTTPSMITEEGHHTNCTMVPEYSKSVVNMALSVSKKSERNWSTGSWYWRWISKNVMLRAEWCVLCAINLKHTDTQTSTHTMCHNPQPGNRSTIYTNSTLQQCNTKLQSASDNYHNQNIAFRKNEFQWWQPRQKFTRETKHI